LDVIRMLIPDVSYLIMGVNLNFLTWVLCLFCSCSYCEPWYRYGKRPCCGGKTGYLCLSVLNKKC
jgi:hypothetical protein